MTECRHLGVHDMFMAEVVGVSVDDRYLDQRGRLALEKADLIAYSHGEYYSLGDKLGSFGFSVRKKTARGKAESSPKTAANASRGKQTQKRSRTQIDRPGVKQRRK